MKFIRQLEVFIISLVLFTTGCNQPNNFSVTPSSDLPANRSDEQTSVEADNQKTIEVKNKMTFSQPMINSQSRLLKKPFGIKILPQNSPIQPERFSGYHTGLDLEILASELNEPVQISAFCGGKLLNKKYATGYGGVAVQECLFDDQAVTVIYGHLKLDSISAEINDYLAPGQKFGLLGAAFSKETDGERKHLHLGIHKGEKIDIRGYVKTEAELTDWLNPKDYLP